MSAVLSASEKRQESWLIEQAKFELARLQAVLRNPSATKEEKRIAGSMLEHYLTGGSK
jgi:hypothetical protein